MRIRSILKKVIIILFILLFYNVLSWAGTTGKIAGIVIDEKGEPLLGANVFVEGTQLGAMTDLNGEYYIINVPPGKYRVKFMFIGYQTAITRDVQVNADLTVRVDATLRQQVLESEDVVIVSANRYTVQKDLTSSETTFSTDKIDLLPVRGVNDIVSLQAGVTRDASGDIHIRGGRTTEISYMVDGVQVLDPLIRRPGISIDDQSIQELKAITGTFNAEYGQALSGVINIVTKSGSEKFKINITGYIGDYFSLDDKVYSVMGNADWANFIARVMTGSQAGYFDFSKYGSDFTDVISNKRYLEKEPYLNSYNPLKSSDVQMNLSGPIPFSNNQITYFVSARLNDSPGYQYGKRYFMPWGYQAPVADSVNSFTAADNKLVPLNWYKGFSSQSKVSFEMSKAINISYGLYYNYDHSFGSAGYDYKYVPDAGKHYYTNSMTHILSLTQVLSQSMFYELKTSYFQKNHKNYMYANTNDYRLMPTESSDFETYVFGPDPDNIYSLTVNPYDFLYAGNPTDRAKTDVAYWSFKLDVTSQITKRHLIKSGISATLHDLSNDWFNMQFDDNVQHFIVPSENSPYHVKYSAKPREYAFYLQDKIEFKELIINLGLRFDYFNSDGHVLADPMDPQIYRPFKLDHIYKNYYEGIPDSELVEYTVAERRAFWYKSASAKYQVSPRFGLSFPITDRGVIHFSYGHFFQNPQFSFLYDNPNFWIEGAGTTNLVGNADLNAERTTMYELGLQQELQENLYFHLTGFYRDIRDWVGTGKPIDTYRGVTYYQYENKDHAAAKGITLSGNYRLKNLILSLDYTYMTAKGTSSNPQDAYNDAIAKREPRLDLINLAWDQRHALNAIISYGAKGWIGTIIGTINSGLPYTPSFARGEVAGSGTFVGLRENSKYKPLTYNVDLRIGKRFNLNKFTTELYLNITNLFDIRNARNVYTDSGQPDYTLAGYTQADRIIEISDLNEYFARPDYYSPPRFIQLGFRISR
jgi:hypothetical protein